MNQQNNLNVENVLLVVQNYNTKLIEHLKHRNKQNDIHCCSFANEENHYCPRQYQRYQEEMSIFKKIVETDVDQTCVFTLIFQHCVNLMDVVPERYARYFPFVKSKLPEKIRDMLDLVIANKFSALHNFSQCDSKEFEKNLKSFNISDWLLCTYSTAKIPLIHSILNKCNDPTTFKILAKCIPEQVWFCPWHIDDNDMTPIQLVCWNYEKNIINKQTVINKTYIESLGEKFRFVRLNESYLNQGNGRYNIDRIQLFNNVCWYYYLRSQSISQCCEDITKSS